MICMNESRLTQYILHYSRFMEVSPVHTRLGEAFGFVCWMWIFHRARCDLPVVLGWRHPWEHAEDPWAGIVPMDDAIEEIDELRADWDKFQTQASNPEDVSFCFCLLFIMVFEGLAHNLRYCRTMMMMMMMTTTTTTRMMMVTKMLKTRMRNKLMIPLIMAYREGKLKESRSIPISSSLLWECNAVQQNTCSFK